MNDTVVEQNGTLEHQNSTVQVPAVVPERRPAEIRVVTDPIAVLDTARFEHMQRIAAVMAASTLVPDSLCMKDKEALPAKIVAANCFLVVNQAVRWGMDPFAVVQCVSVVHGKLCYEGKLIAAVLEAKLGIRLDYSFTGNGEQMTVRVTGKLPDGAVRTIDGSVAEWKTTRSGSPWVPLQYQKMLAYRGTREWARLYAPGMMLGVYSDDELVEIAHEARAQRARDVTPTEQQTEQPAQPDGVKLINPGPNGARKPPSAKAAQAPQPKAEPAQEPKQEAEFNSEAWRLDLEDKLSKCTSVEGIQEYRKAIDTAPDGVTKDDVQAAEVAMKATIDRVVLGK